MRKCNAKYFRERFKEFLDQKEYYADEDLKRLEQFVKEEFILIWDEIDNIYGDIGRCERKDDYC